MIFLRSLLFMVALVFYTPPFALFFLLMRPLPGMTRYRIVQGWTRVALWLVKHLLGIKYRVEGRENLPAGPAVILCKHQSAWETMALQEIFPPVSFVLKRELLRIPFFGWGLASIPSIAIDRSAGRDALEQVLEQGRQRLQEGFWVVIFPEGTRTAPGTTRRYKPGGAYLAAKTGAPVVPVAHNAGEFWRRQAFLKYPGTVTVSIGPAIDTRGLTPDEINARTEAWIEAEMRRISPHRYGVRKDRVAA
ncbi:MAG: lysophospholipid acyltransferase family protein [Pseudomonadota bacterium]